MFYNRNSVLFHSFAPPGENAFSCPLHAASALCMPWRSRGDAKQLRHRLRVHEAAQLLGDQGGGAKQLRHRLKVHEAAQLLGDPGGGAKQLRELQQQIDIIQETLFRGSYALLCGLRPPYSLPHPAMHSYKMCSPMRSCSFGSSGGRQSMRRIKFGMWPPHAALCPAPLP